MTYVVGTAEWYFLGGAVGAVLQKIWDGLKTGEEGEEWFQ
jgi:cobalamin biosynthesis protein CobD/CbiB